MTKSKLEIVELVGDPIGDFVQVRVSRELFTEIKQSSFAYLNQERPILPFTMKKIEDEWVKVFIFEDKQELLSITKKVISNKNPDQEIYITEFFADAEYAKKNVKPQNDFKGFSYKAFQEAKPETQNK